MAARSTAQAKQTYACFVFWYLPVFVNGCYSHINKLKVLVTPSKSASSAIQDLTASAQKAVENKKQPGKRLRLGTSKKTKGTVEKEIDSKDCPERVPTPEPEPSNSIALVDSQISKKVRTNLFYPMFAPKKVAKVPEVDELAFVPPAPTPGA